VEPPRDELHGVGPGLCHGPLRRRSYRVPETSVMRMTNVKYEVDVMSRVFSLILSTMVLLRADGVTLPAGASIVVRTIDAIDSKSAGVGQSFKGSVDEPVIVSGREVARKGSDAVLKIVEAKTSGKLKGNAELSIMLVSVKAGDQV